MTRSKPYTKFREFFPLYLSEHSNQTSRRMHFIGSNIAVILLVLAVVQRDWRFVVLALGQGYAFAWVGHFFFEHNKPATFKYPFFAVKVMGN